MRNFDSLSEREVLALAIGMEERIPASMPNLRGWFEGTVPAP